MCVWWFQIARDDSIYQRLAKSVIAPEIYGRDDIKKAVAAQLFSGVRQVALLFPFLSPFLFSLRFPLPFFSPWTLTEKDFISPAFLFVLFLNTLQVLPDGIKLRGDIHVLLLGYESYNLS